MKALFSTLFIFLSLNAYASFYPVCDSTPKLQSQNFKPLEIWPWPWGTECPFPWNDVEGTWEINEVGDLIQLKVLSKGKTGERFLRITHLSSQGYELAQGYGYAAPDQKIITASLNYKVNGHSVDYWVYVRSYTDADVCRKGNRVMAITFRPAEKCNSQLDQHFTLNKLK